MKLLNPTDDQLDASFAEHVAGWNPVCHCGDRMDKHRHDEHVPVQMDEPLPSFTSSFDAVLPWLEKCDSWRMEYDQGEIEETIVNLWAPYHGQYKGDGPLPRAVSIALLRAHGVEVEFTT